MSFLQLLHSWKVSIKSEMQNAQQEHIPHPARQQNKQTRAFPLPGSLFKLSRALFIFVKGELVLDYTVVPQDGQAHSGDCDP